MKLKLVKSTSIDSWYTIEKAEHDGRVWLERTGPNRMSLRCSSRISDADVEGCANNMLGIAAAIRERGSFAAKRCSVDVNGDRVAFRSPRNSQIDGIVSLEDADDLADQIERALGPEAPPTNHTRDTRAG